LQAQERQVEPTRERGGEVCLADTGRAFDQDRLAQAMGQENSRRNLFRGDVPHAFEARSDCVNGSHRLVAGGKVFSHA
jgi:hypothetical protein